MSGHARFAVSKEIREGNGIGGVFSDGDLHTLTKDAPAWADMGNVVVDDVLIHAQPLDICRQLAYVD
jgi:hypothetical protein